MGQEDRILNYLAGRAATPEHLEKRLEITSEEVRQTLDELERRQWVMSAKAWYGNDPSTALTVE